MAQRVTAGSEGLKLPRQWTGRVWSLLLVAAGVFLALCLLTYQPADVPVLSSHPQRPAGNLGGALGAWIGFAGRAGFGGASFLVPLLCVLWAWQLWRGTAPEWHPTSFTIASLCLMASVGTLLALNGATDVARTDLGGVSGYLFARLGAYYLGTIGTVLTALCVAVLSWLVVAGQTLEGAGLGLLRRAASTLSARLRRTSLGLDRETAPRAAARPVPARASAEAADVDASADDADIPAERTVRIRSTVQPNPRRPAPVPVPRPRSTGGFQLPSLGLLADPEPPSERQLSEDLQRNAKILEETLREFGVEASVAHIDRGPTVTRFEMTPAPGIKITKIVSLADDLALALKASSCHVAAIPGKDRVGVDVPNITASTVSLKEVLATQEFQTSRSPITLPIGKDTSGAPILTDLRECPHLLIAGATGSGKTVCLNSILVGIMCHASPEQVKFLMVDPKMVELSIFNNVPHLVAPVVTQTKKAAGALQWAVAEMERRYERFARVGARNIDAYNARITAGGGPVRTAAAEGGEGEEADDGRPLPYLVIVIDELADLMMVAAQDVEGAITRLAQLSRAVGIHIILATQRPSVDVITGVIKANFPARIAFQVASKVDSRTILDANGADKLLGRGDLLFLRPGSGKPVRVQGAYVSDAEIERVTSFLKAQQAPEFDERLLEHHQQPEGTVAAGEKDEMYEMAKQLILDTGQASTSYLQRRLRLGYGRAARILDVMEQEGLVGPPQGSRPREVLATRGSTG